MTVSDLDAVKAWARNALDDVQANHNLVSVGTPDGGWQITTMDVRTAGLVSVAPTLIPALLAALEHVEADRDDCNARLVDAADALSPAIGATVGGRGVAMAAKQIVAERNRALEELDELKDAMLRAMGSES